MSDIDVDAIEARANAATPGPWHWILGYGIGVAGVGAITLDGDGPRMTPDQDFVCRARTDVPALIARVREQEQEIATLKENAARTRDAFVALNRHCLRLNIPITETAWHHGHRVSEEDSAWGATLLANMCALLGIAVAEAQP